MKIVNTKYQFQITRLNNAKGVKCINDYIIRILYTNIFIFSQQLEPSGTFCSHLMYRPAT